MRHGTHPPPSFPSPARIHSVLERLALVFSVRGRTRARKVRHKVVQGERSRAEDPHSPSSSAHMLHGYIYGLVDPYLINGVGRWTAGFHA